MRLLISLLAILLSLSVISLTLAKPAPPPIKNIGSSLASQKPSSPSDHTNYFYFGAGDHGEGRSMQANDVVIGEAMKWGVKFYFQQFHHQIRTKFDLANPHSLRIPSVDEYNRQISLPQGTNVMLSCYDQDLYNLQNYLNQKCAKDPKCTSIWIAVSLWGTIGKMDFIKDGILLRACVLVEADTSGDCGFPHKSSCKTRVFKDLTLATDYGSVKEGDITEFGPATNLWQVTTILKDWAAKNKKRITLPNGQLTP